MKSPGGFGLLQSLANSAPPVVPIRFADLLTAGVYQACQTDFSANFGSFLVPAAGNTSTSTIAVSAGSAKRGPVWFQLTSSTQANIYYDGLGVTVGETVSVVPDGDIFLTGPGAGIRLTPSATGTLVAGSVWKATSEFFSDSVASVNYSQFTQSAQPLFTAGLNGKPGLLFDASNDCLTCPPLNVPFPFLQIVIGRITAHVAGANALVGGAGYSSTIYEPIGNQFAQYNGVSGVSQVFTATTNQRWVAKYTGTTADSLKIGSLPEVTGVYSGPASGALVRHIGATGTAPGQFAAAEIFAVFYCPVQSLVAFDAALNSPGGYGPGAIVV